MSFNSQMVKAYASTVVALSGVTAGNITSAAALVLNPGGSQNIEWDSLCANVSAGITTTSLRVVTLWQVSQDGTTWRTMYGMNSPANVQVAADGTGSLVTTAYAHSFPGVNPAYPYVRLAILSTGATGAAGDNVTISYNWRRRFAGV